MLKKALKYSMLLMLIAACTSTELEKFYTFPNNTWKRFENPLINMEITKPGIFYDLFVEVAYDKNLSPESIPISVITTTPDGEVRSISIVLKLGDGNGTLRQILRKDFAFSEAGNCTFEFENRSQKIETPGIQKIGVVFEKVD